MTQIRRGDIYYISLGYNIGSETNKDRPCLIFSNDIGNEKGRTLIVIPISHRNGNYLPTQIEIRPSDLTDRGHVDGLVLGEQIRTVDKQRVGNFVGRVSNRYLRKVEQCVKIALGMH